MQTPYVSPDQGCDLLHTVLGLKLPCDRLASHASSKEVIFLCLYLTETVIYVGSDPDLWSFYIILPFTMTKIVHAH